MFLRREVVAFVLIRLAHASALVCLCFFFFEFRSRLKGVNIIVVNPEASKLAGVWASRMQDRGDPKVFIRIAKHFWDIWSKMIQIIWAGPEMLSV